MEENNKDIVFLKREIKEDVNWEKNPHLMFTIILIISIILFFGLMFFLININCPGIIMALILIGMWIPVIYYVINTNKEKNITKNGAFVLRNKVLYYIELGYDVNYQVIGTPTNIILGGLRFAHDVEVAKQVQMKETEIREARKHAETFANALDRIINNNSEKLVPEGIHSFCEMNDFKIESVNEKEFTISYVNKYTNGNRVAKKYRNIYEGLIEHIQNN